MADADSTKKFYLVLKAKYLPLPERNVSSPYKIFPRGTLFGEHHDLCKTLDTEEAQYAYLTMRNKLQQDIGEISEKAKDFLLAIASRDTRCEVYEEGGTLAGICRLKVLDRVEVSVGKNSERCLGTVRFIGQVGRALKGSWFGVELDRERDGRNSDGYFDGEFYFKCSHKRGIFVDASRIFIVKPGAAAKKSEPPPPCTFDKRDTVAFFIDFRDEPLRGVISDLWLNERRTGWNAEVKVDPPLVMRDGKVNTKLIVAVGSLMTETYLKETKEEATASRPVHPDVASSLISEKGQSPNKSPHIPENAVDEQAHERNYALKQQQKIEQQFRKANQVQEEMRVPDSDIREPPSHGHKITSLMFDSMYPRHLHPVYPLTAEDQNPFALTENSTCFVTIETTKMYGVIRFIGELNGFPHGQLFAGIEMDDDLPDGFGTNGQFGNTQYFYCDSRKGTFARLCLVEPDTRFREVEPPQSLFNVEGHEENVAVAPPLPTKTNTTDNLCGSNGIQGHHNSCYMDATLFAMFFGTCVFDTMLGKPDIRQDCKHLQLILRTKIVYPLRKNLKVSAKSVMELRKELEKLLKVHGLTHAEKDPEEFLTGLAEVLAFEPLTSLSTGQSTLLYQLICERKEGQKTATVQELFSQSFASSGVTMKEVPTCLVLQMPRFGKEFKLYERIIPSLTLDVTEQLQQYVLPGCFQCDHPSQFKCLECTMDAFFCDRHMKEHTKHNKFEPLKCAASKREVLELVGVVCIATSHYISYVRCGSARDARWIFFDSMADRYNEENIPKIKECPRNLHELMDDTKVREVDRKHVRDMDELERRLVHDGYLCIYEHATLSKY